MYHVPDAIRIQIGYHSVSEKKKLTIACFGFPKWCGALSVFAYTTMQIAFCVIFQWICMKNSQYKFFSFLFNLNLYLWLKLKRSFVQNAQKKGKKSHRTAHSIVCPYYQYAMIDFQISNNTNDIFLSGLVHQFTFFSFFCHFMNDSIAHLIQSPIFQTACPFYSIFSIFNSWYLITIFKLIEF